MVKIAVVGLLGLLVLIAGCINVNTGTKIGLLGDVTPASVVATQTDAGLRELNCGTEKDCRDFVGVPADIAISCSNGRCYTK